MEPFVWRPDFTRTLITITSRHCVTRSPPLWLLHPPFRRHCCGRARRIDTLLSINFRRHRRHCDDNDDDVDDDNDDGDILNDDDDEVVFRGRVDVMKQ
jgi:hypothetical protein